MMDHRFLDESGDTTFFSKGKQLIVGQLGVSRSFSIGMVEISDALREVREQVLALQSEVEADAYLNVIPSVRKKIENGGFFFHACDDPPEVRQLFFKYLKDLNCSVDVVVARKKPELFISKHNSRETEFYADVLSHLIKANIKPDRKLVLNIAHRANSTSNKNLQAALEKATGKPSKECGLNEKDARVVFNVQSHRTEPLLNIADYLCWPVQRVFERGETRHYDFLGDRIRLVVDLYDQDCDDGKCNRYCSENRLTSENKLGPLSP